MLKKLLIACFSVSLGAATLDRIVLAIGSGVITETQLEEEIAVTAFLNHSPVQETPDERRSAAHRLVQQSLISRDMRLAHFPESEPAQVDRVMHRIEEDNGSTAKYQDALSSYGISEGLLRAHVRLQLATLRFIEYRFRPELTISEDELHSAYNRRAADWSTHHGNSEMPDFESSRAELRADLLESRTDQALDDWLKQTSSQERIVYLDPSLRSPK